MLGDAGVEGIRGQAVPAGEKPEPGFGHDQVKVARSRADRAVALRDADLGGRLDFEPDAAAVAAAGVDYGYSIQPHVFWRSIIVGRNDLVAVTGAQDSCSKRPSLGAFPSRRGWPRPISSGQPGARKARISSAPSAMPRFFG